MRSYHSLSLFSFLLLGLSVGCLCLYDILRQTTTVSPVTTIQLTAIALGSTLLVLIVSLFTSISRYFTVKHSLSLIPKPYIPISQVDLPNPIFQLISRELGRTALISYLASNPIPHPPPLPLPQKPFKQRLGLAGWGIPASSHHGKRFADQILQDLNSLGSALDGLLPLQPNPPIPTRHSSTILGPLTPYLNILSPSSPTQPTPILLTPPQKLILNRYAELLQRSISPNSIVTQSDYELACKSLVVLINQIKLCRSAHYSNPHGFGPKDHPLYQGVRFKDAIVETAIKLGTPTTHPSTLPTLKTYSPTLPPHSYLEQALAPQLAIQPTKLPKPNSQTIPPILIQSNPPISALSTRGKEAIDNLLKKIFPLIYPPFLPSAFGPIITGYETLIKDIAFLHPLQERSLEEYEYSLRCISSLISHVQQTLTN